MRQYPNNPIVSAGGVVITDDRRVLLTKRKNPPAAGTWSLPGGVIELGETSRDALARELLEETGLVVEVGRVIDVFDRIFTDAAGRIEYQYVIIDYLCRPIGGTLAAGSDVEALALADPTQLEEFHLTEPVQQVIAKALS
jgi:8-oxo-dGTP diphosphatase